MSFKHVKQKCTAYRCENGYVYERPWNPHSASRPCWTCHGEGWVWITTIDWGAQQTAKNLPAKVSKKRNISAGDMLTVVFIIGFFALVITGG